MTEKKALGTNLRKYMQQTRTRVIVGFLLLLFIIGDGLIFALYGREPFLMALLCTGLALAPAILVGIFLWGLEILTKRLRDE
ncbi:MAG: hypothetical protein JXA25_11075 [Anaerolineales bacterium]|nr:hypothetical protein [Anaerolineales bacterium]